MTKIYLKFVLITVIFFIISTTYIFYAYLLDTDVIDTTVPIGQVKVDYHIYFDDGLTTADAEEVFVGSYGGVDYYKSGVYHVNISDPSALNYIENLRIDFHVSSNIDTYFRVILEEQMTMTRVDELGIKTEYTYIADSSDLNYDLDSWYFSPILNKKYWYYKTPIKQIDAEPEVVSFVLPYFNDRSYIPKSNSYSIQIAIRIDAVQAIMGPENNWHLPTKPWGGNWS